ncbi:hypothetical protein [Sulfitobacter sp. CW3]|uniref:hypothetical protein n=1 Tax=Sulfitobacter sp. CW3 TaxID=2861965 RepID=UPI001C5E7523|nr:hypothetical protein [Sulfitobacter sp. CW3]MBW4962173.1 hypothetical protein [Sulfitobacter sp. CW3]
MAQTESFSFYNLENDDLDKPIYRIFPKERLIQMFDEQKNVLVRPGKWEDPFENFILKSTAMDSEGNKVTFSFHDEYYGQCWTTLKASDAMWRIYSPDRFDVDGKKLPPNGLRIKTTMRKLADSLGQPCGKFGPVQSSIGKVRYLKDAELKDFAKNGLRSAITGESIAQTLLAKRKAFSHEREIRLIYSDINNSHSDSDIYKYKIDPHDLIDQIMLDPRLTPEEAKAVKAEVRSKTKFKGTVKRSFLYTLSDDLVVNV